ncbi:MAG: tRNA 2-thiouridine(34) synthase MnmA [Desulfobacula sp.]|nr:tRNA 2-thiouridine(34) synthase MnmA [Desulfobacula sp.]
MKKNPVIAVALSGGVDSLVSGYLLKQKYKHVFGLHFITGYEKTSIDIQRLEQQLGFCVTCIDLSRAFEEKVIRYFIKTYLEGRTPNPCIICNKTIKFGTLLDHAIGMGADFLATGHYATIINSICCSDQKLSGAYLKKGKDPLKDQSYFLSLLSEDQLKKIIFPLAAMKKRDVKQYARSHNIAPLHPSESQDICFIHDNNFAKFIVEKQGTTPKHGDIIDIHNKIVGTHAGLHQFTIGQRRGINCPASEPYYVRSINMKENLLEVCFKKDLLQKEFLVKHINWNYSPRKIIKQVTTKIRYSHKGALSTLYMDNNCGRVVFDTPQNAVTPGQAAVFYKGDRVLGAGIIQ